MMYVSDRFDRPVVAFLAARVAFGLSMQMVAVALGWHLYEASGDPFDLALVGLIFVLPIFIFFFLTGFVIDRVPRKGILMGATILDALAFLGLALAFDARVFDPRWVYALVFVHGCAHAFFTPAQAAVLANIVTPRLLPQAIALNSTMGHAATTVGPFLAGVLILWIDRDVYWVMCAVVAICPLLYLSLPRLTLPQQEKTSRMDALLGGLVYLKRSPVVLGSLGLDLVAVLFGSVIALLPVFAVDVLGADADGLGILRAMPAVGSVLVGLTLTRSAPMERVGHKLFVVLVLFAMSILVFGLSTSFWLSCLALFVYGAVDMVSVNIRMSLVQLATPDALRGRVNTVNSLFTASSNHLGAFRAGSVAAWIGPVPAVLVGGAMAMAVAIGGWYLFPSIRRLNRVQDVGEQHAPQQ